MAIDKIDKIKWDQPWQESFKKAKKIRRISDDTNQGCQKEPRRGGACRVTGPSNAVSLMSL